MCVTAHVYSRLYYDYCMENGCHFGMFCPIYMKDQVSWPLFIVATMTRKRIIVVLEKVKIVVWIPDSMTTHVQETFALIG